MTIRWSRLSRPRRRHASAGGMSGSSRVSELYAENFGVVPEPAVT